MPTEFLGTTLTAAPVLSMICAIGMFGAIMVYLLWQQRGAVAKGEIWSYPEGKSEQDYGVMEQSKLPPAWKAFLPIIVLASIIITGSRFKVPSTMLAVFAMLCGALLCFILNFKVFKNVDLKETVTTGLGGGISGIGGLAAVLAFGTVVQSTPSFTRIVEWVLSLLFTDVMDNVFTKISAPFSTALW